jgi:hypothetical protein
LRDIIHVLRAEKHCNFYVEDIKELWSKTESNPSKSIVKARSQGLVNYMWDKLHHISGAIHSYNPYRFTPLCASLCLQPFACQLIAKLDSLFIEYIIYSGIILVGFCILIMLMYVFFTL